MQLNHDEICTLAQTINPSVEYYRQLASQPFATRYDREILEVLEELQTKLEEHLK